MNRTKVSVEVTTGGGVTVKQELLVSDSILTVKQSIESQIGTPCMDARLFLANRAAELTDNEIIGGMLPIDKSENPIENPVPVLLMALLVEEPLKFARCGATATIMIGGDQVSFARANTPRQLGGTALIGDCHSELGQELAQPRAIRLRLVRFENRWTFVGICMATYDLAQPPVQRSAWTLCSNGTLFSNGTPDRGEEDILFGPVGHHPPFGRTGAEVKLYYRADVGELDWWLDGQPQVSVKGIVASEEGLCFCVGSSGGGAWRLY
jgi:hypothetical protein